MVVLRINEGRDSGARFRLNKVEIKNEGSGFEDRGAASKWGRFFHPDQTLFELHFGCYVRYA